MKMVNRWAGPVGSVPSAAPYWYGGGYGNEP